ncbi:hypothetical protein HZS_1827 [Henneguya salminicola]|nr:hypothetical protein HZS_1827 [Henneguya salminicola]
MSASLTLSVFLISLSAALLNELISYIFLYRHKNYKNLVNKVNEQAKISFFSLIESGEKKCSPKQEKNILESFDKANETLKAIRIKSTLISGVTFTTLIAFFNRIFAGKVIATLPFQPISIIRGISHRNITDTNYYHCSFIFLYIICSASIKQNLSKFLDQGESSQATKIAQNRYK